MKPPGPVLCSAAQAVDKCTRQRHILSVVRRFGGFSCNMTRAEIIEVSVFSKMRGRIEGFFAELALPLLLRWQRTKDVRTCRMEGRGHPAGTTETVLLTQSPDGLAEGRGCQSSGGCFFAAVTSLSPLQVALYRFTSSRGILAFPHHSRRRRSNHARGSHFPDCHSPCAPALSLSRATEEGSAEEGSGAARDRSRDDEGRQGLQGRAALLGAAGRTGLVGQHVRRSEGPTHRLRPVRRAVPHHASAYRDDGRREDREDSSKIGSAQGLLWAFDASTSWSTRKKSGLYRVTSSNNDDTLDKVELLRAFEGGGGEHGPHAVLPHPDGKPLTVVCGNQTKLDEIRHARTCRRSGAKTTCCRECPTATAS